MSPLLSLQAKDWNLVLYTVLVSELITSFKSSVMLFWSQGFIRATHTVRPVLNCYERHHQKLTKSGFQVVIWGISWWQSHPISHAAKKERKKVRSNKSYASFCTRALSTFGRVGVEVNLGWLIVRIFVSLLCLWSLETLVRDFILKKTCLFFVHRCQFHWIWPRIKAPSGEFVL